MRLTNQIHADGAFISDVQETQKRNGVEDEFGLSPRPARLPCSQWPMRQALVQLVPRQSAPV